MSRQLQIDLGHPKSRLLDTVGDGTGAIDLRVDGSVTPVDFKLTVPAGSTFYMFSITAYVEGSPVSSSGWAGGAALAIGLDFGIDDAGFESVIPQKSIKTAGDFAIVGADTTVLLGAAGDSVTASLDLVVKYGAARKLLSGTSYVCRVRDNLTALGDGTYIRVGYVEVKDPIIT